MELYFIVLAPFILTQAVHSKTNLTYISDQEMISKYQEKLKWTGYFEKDTHGHMIYKADVIIDHNGLYRACQQFEKHGIWKCSNEVAVNASASKPMIYEMQFASNQKRSYFHIRMIGQYKVGNKTVFVATPSHNAELMFDESAPFNLVQKILAGILGATIFLSCTYLTCDICYTCCRRRRSIQRFNQYHARDLDRAIDIESTEEYIPNSASY